MTKFFKGSVALSVLLAGFAFNGFALEGKERNEARDLITKVQESDKGDTVNVKALAFFKKMTDREEEKGNREDKDLGELRGVLKAKGFSDKEIDAGRRN